MYKIPTSQAEFLANRKAAYTEDFYPKLWEKIEDLVKDTIIVPREEDSRSASDICERGILFSLSSLKKIDGKISACHQNSAEVFLENVDIYRIATGYALSSDGLWRQHSWVVEATSSESDYDTPSDWNIIETTEVRDEYFGYIMNISKSYDFAARNR